jgi:hypothetical protein
MLMVPDFFIHFLPDPGFCCSRAVCVGLESGFGGNFQVQFGRVPN